MKVRCEKSELSQAIGTVQRAVSGRSTLPILSNILIQTVEGKLRLLAYDLEIGIQCEVPVSIEAEGSTTVPARILSEVVAALPEAELSIEVDEDNKVTLVCEKSNYTIHGLPAEEFPALPAIQDDPALEVSRVTLRQMIRQTSFASSVDETRPILTGILTTCDGSRLTMVATDTHRLAWAWSDLPGEARELSAIVPARAYNELFRLLGSDEDQPCSILLSESQAQFVVDNVVLQSRLIEGQFPNWEKVIPREQDKRVTCDTKALTTALRRAAIVAREDTNKVVLDIQPDTLTISADSHDIGTAREELPIELEGEALKIAFNARYLLDALAVIESDTVILELKNDLDPAVLRAAESEQFTYVLMPMQLSSG